jgi:hypothetical protein
MHSYGYRGWLRLAEPLCNDIVFLLAEYVPQVLPQLLYFQVLLTNLFLQEEVFIVHLCC